MGELGTGPRPSVQPERAPPRTKAEPTGREATLRGPPTSPRGTVPQAHNPRHVAVWVGSPGRGVQSCAHLAVRLPPPPGVTSLL